MDLVEAIPFVGRIIREEVFPGAAFAAGGDDEVETAFLGRFEYCPESRPVDATTLALPSPPWGREGPGTALPENWMALDSVSLAIKRCLR
ncbi:hypothetical protein EON81_24550 [bacterium]|nr:MAG: hypothetical protein EON81_24550 [bacterium]